jgi:hypothetical protein
MLEDLWGKDDEQEGNHPLDDHNATRTFHNRFHDFGVELADTAHARMGKDVAVEASIMVEEIRFDGEHEQGDRGQDGHRCQEHRRVIIREEAQFRIKLDRFRREPHQPFIDPE